MKLLILFMTFFSLNIYAENDPVYHITSGSYEYPKIIQQYIWKDLKQPNPLFKSSILMPEKELNSELISHLIVDKIKYSYKKEKEGLIQLDIDYSDHMKTNKYSGITNNYLHIIGFRINYYIKSEKCNFAQLLKNENKSPYELGVYGRTSIDDFWYFNYATVNLVSRKDIDEALDITSKYCSTSLKQLSNFEQLLDKMGFLKPKHKVIIPENYAKIELNDILKDDYFNK